MTNSKPIDIHAVLAERGQIAIVWSTEDVQAIRPDLSDDQSWHVLETVERRHDAALGITWDTLDWVARDLFGNGPDNSNA
jgi:hypothetical protein